jgi:signal transduction histidine kinase/CheY-like chemotaxis protein
VKAQRICGYLVPVRPVEIVLHGVPNGGDRLVLAVRDLTIEHAQQRDLLAARRRVEELTTRVAERTKELTAANAQLAAASHAKDEFLAGMSHELRTPLNAVLNMSESLQEGIYGPLTEKQEGPVRMVEESGRHLLSLINDILDLAKVESGAFHISIEPVIVEDICQASLRFINEAAHRKRLKVTTTFDRQVATIRADSRRLKQILVNLLSNAVKFTPEGGTIGLEVEGSSENNTVRFTVWDTGVGISAEDQSRLFKPFVQLDAGLDRRYEGTGLGLSLVAAMTELHGGSVYLASPGHGHGSRFTISLPWSATMVNGSPNAPLPLVPLAPSPIPDSNFIEGPGTGSDQDSRPLILLAEDNKDNITSMCDFLQEKGYRIVVARDGAAAVDVTRREHPDLILMDIQMPKVDGLEATRELRKDPDFAEVPIVALTALAMLGDRERCLAAGTNEYMSKPVNLKKLHKTIQRLLRRDANHPRHVHEGEK